MISWDKLTHSDLAKVNQAVDRALELLPWESMKMDLHMDLTASVIQGHINLDKLLTFDDSNFIHDVVGVVQHLNRQTGEMMNCFLPRSAH